MPSRTAIVIALMAFVMSCCAVSPPAAASEPDESTYASELYSTNAYGYGTVPLGVSLKEFISQFSAGSWEQANKGWIYRLRIEDQLTQSITKAALYFEWRPKGDVGSNMVLVFAREAVNGVEMPSTQVYIDVTEVVAAIKQAKVPNTKGAAAPSQSTKSSTISPQPRWESYVGTHPTDFLGDRDVRNFIQPKLGYRYQKLLYRVQVASAVELADQEYLIGSGCAPHSCGSEDGFFLINIKTGELFAAMANNGVQEVIYGEGIKMSPAVAQRYHEWEANLTP